MDWSKLLRVSSEFDIWAKVIFPEALVPFNSFQDLQVFMKLIFIETKCDANRHSAIFHHRTVFLLSFHFDDIPCEKKLVVLARE